MRFNYRGTGASADIEPDADLVHDWSVDVAAAVSELRRQTGVRRVCLLRFRMGALLAALVARDYGEIFWVIVIAPIMSGRRYVREIRTTRMAAMTGFLIAAGAQHTADAKAAAGLTPLEVSGYFLAPANLASLGKVNLCGPDESSRSITDKFRVVRGEIDSAIDPPGISSGRIS